MTLKKGETLPLPNQANIPYPNKAKRIVLRLSNALLQNKSIYWIKGVLCEPRGRESLFLPHVEGCLICFHTKPLHTGGFCL
ncbi:hypothetical protein CEXT_452791 [Caerostris extrusa]|uniref:Uncharacterized protein n=1 Tax=Caerostris extrusa TaxID=172846 RepID=A0AAV4MVC3_CAEEX|nr:hypothetical protein CEXT_452791 [Caerostris extrusa]